MSKRQTLSTLSLLWLFAIPSFSQFNFDQQITSWMQKASVPGVTMVVIDNGRVAYNGAHGVRSMDGNVPVSDNTVFAAASLSKPVFTFGLMQLVEEGKFDLDKPLADYFKYDDLQHEARYFSITARMVLSHTSGLPNGRNGRLELLFDPGTKFSYSTEGFLFLQKAIERVTGQSLEDFMQQRVFKPLGMSRSSFVWQKSYDQGNDFAIPHDEMGITQSKLKPREGEAGWSLQTTAADYARFVIAMMNGIGIRRESLDKMLTKQVAVNESNAAVGWGLGWGLQENSAGKAFWHWGHANEFRCFTLAFPERKSGVVFFTNSHNGLSFVEELVKLTLDSPCEACQWMDYVKYEEPAFQLPKLIREKGLDLALDPFLVLGGSHQDTNQISEGLMNELGYRLLRQNRMEDAKKVFRMNIEAFPNSANAYDSFGEALLRNGEYDLAAENYRRAGSLDPANGNARSIVEQLSGRARGNTTFNMQGYSNARLITLAGDFNGWNDLSLPFFRKDGEWSCVVELTPGRHEYKFVVDGVWIPDPGNPVVSDDVNHNSMVEIRGAVRPGNTEYGMRNAESSAPATAAAAPPPSPDSYRETRNVTLTAAQELIQRSAEALGGKAKWKDLKSYSMTMKEIGGGGLELQTWMRKPNKYRIDFANSSNRMTKTYTGTKGVLSINYRNTDMSEGEAKELAEEVDFYDELLFAEEKGYTLEALGIETIDDDKQAQKIKLTKGKGDEQFYYLDTETGLPVLFIEHSQDENFKGVQFRLELSDYRSVEGLKFPFKMTLLANDRQMWSREVESIKINPKLEDKVFDFK